MGCRGSQCHLSTCSRCAMASRPRKRPSTRDNFVYLVESCQNCYIPGRAPLKPTCLGRQQDLAIQRESHIVFNCAASRGHAVQSTRPARSGWRWTVLRRGFWWWWPLLALLLLSGSPMLTFAAAAAASKTHYAGAYSLSPLSLSTLRSIILVVNVHLSLVF